MTVQAISKQIIALQNGQSVNPEDIRKGLKELIKTKFDEAMLLTASLTDLLKEDPVQIEFEARLLLEAESTQDQDRIVHLQNRFDVLAEKSEIRPLTLLDLVNRYQH